MSLLIENSETIGMQRGYLALRCAALDDLCTRLGAQAIQQGRFPATWLNNQDQRDVDEKTKHRYHVTLCLPKELKSLGDDQAKALREDFQATIGHGVFCHGVGVTKNCSFVALCIPRAATLRRKYGLAPKDFHATLGFDAFTGDDHAVAKGLDAVREAYSSHELKDLQQYWLELARSNFQSHRKQQPADLDLADISALCRAVVTNLVVTSSKHLPEVMEPWCLLWCRVAGLAEEYKLVIEAADHLLVVNPQDAPALGYKGFAQFRMQQYEQALVNLDQAHTLFMAAKSINEKHLRHAHQVEDCLVHCCQALGRELPTPPLVKFPRTAHVFRPTDSKAVTEDDQVLAKDSAMLKLMGERRVLLQEKIDGSNLGLSLSYDGQQIYVQNRSHYISCGDHAQYGPINTWIDVHRDALLQILKSHDKRSSRHGLILYGEWMVARHSIPYHKLPSYFIAFDLYDIAEEKFYSQERLHNILRGTGIPVVPTVGEHMLDPSAGSIETQLVPFLETRSKFRTDGGPVEGIVFRIDEGEWLSHRGKLVRPDFVAGCSEGHWAVRAIEKQTLSFDDDYMEKCYDLAPSADELPVFVEQTRARFVVVYKGGNTPKRPDIVQETTKTNDDNPLLVRMPRNLSWLWPNEVAVSSTPKNAEQIRAFYDAMGITLVITLTQETPLCEEWFNFDGCQNSFMPTPNYCPPTINQMDAIGDTVVRRIAAGEAVLEHCGGGKGRAGTVAACLLLRFGREGIRARIQAEGGALFPRAPFMTSDESIREIRQVRPESIETEVQEEFVRLYAEHLWRTYTEHYKIMGGATSRNFVPSSPPTKGAPKYVVLMGLPGSGKSTVARALVKVGKTPETSFIHAEQDEMGHRACVDFVGRMSGKVSHGENAGIVVDCTNVTAKHRSEWFCLMHDPPKEHCALVFVQRDVEKCIRSVSARTNHQSIPFGRGDTIVNGFSKRLEPPTDEEQKRFGMVRTLESHEDIERFLGIWGLSRLE